jgi:hypothetical protein
MSIYDNYSGNHAYGNNAMLPPKEYPKYIVVLGNPFDGLTCYGPYDEAEEANEEFADCQDTYVVVELHDPNPIE